MRDYAKLAHAGDDYSSDGSDGAGVACYASVKGGVPPRGDRAQKAGGLNSTRKIGGKYGGGKPTSNKGKDKGTCDACGNGLEHRNHSAGGTTRPPHCYILKSKGLVFSKKFIRSY